MKSTYFEDHKEWFVSAKNPLWSPGMERTFSLIGSDEPITELQFSAMDFVVVDKDKEKAKARMQKILKTCQTMKRRKGEKLLTP